MGFVLRMVNKIIKNFHAFVKQFNYIAMGKISFYFVKKF